MTTPAGWYPDASTPGTQRYWDGQQWTDHTAPLADGAADAPAAAPAELATAAPGSGSGRGKVAGGIAAGLLVLAGGAFAVTQLASADGGADDPEAAVSALFEAVSEEDLVGIGEVLLPGERRTFVDPALEGLDHLQRWGVLDDSLDTSDIDGIDLEVTDLELRADPVADDIVNVYASGAISGSIDGEELPIGSLLRERALQDADMSQLSTRPAPPEQFEEVMITAVREDGRWYVSGLHTVAELARADAGLDLPSADQAVQPVGAESPEAAVDGFFEAVEDFDIEGVIARLNPDEVQALQRYAPLFLRDLQTELDRAVQSEGLTMSIDDTEYEVVRRDGIAVVTLSSLSATFTDGSGSEMSMSFDGECVTTTIDGVTEQMCGDDAPQSAIDLTDTPLGNLEEMFSDMDEIGLVVAQRDGGWYISPVRSYSEAVLAVMRVIDREDIERTIDAVEDGSLVRWFQEELESLGGSVEDTGVLGGFDLAS